MLTFEYLPRTNAKLSDELSLSRCCENSGRTVHNGCALKLVPGSCNRTTHQNKSQVRFEYQLQKQTGRAGTVEQDLTLHTHNEAFRTDVRSDWCVAVATNRLCAPIIYVGMESVHRPSFIFNAKRVMVFQQSTGVANYNYIVVRLYTIEMKVRSTKRIQHSL